ncbi:hypothetical protein BDZ88DRAFT_83786 [Geranomyces variabilis]|nr:hypothetical protein BDZ88DRAFT_83786 [Geranomyces variabilis]KAJ3137169.1 hypothetical protein HDU90_002341 [Geranomyces variabilis]
MRTPFTAAAAATAALLLLLATAQPALAAHFSLGTAYRYHVRSSAVSDADFEHTILSAGGSPAASANSHGATSYIFNADIEIVAYNVSDDGKTLCAVKFLSSPKLVMGNANGQQTQTQQGQGHDASGSFDFNAKWFGFALHPTGVVDHVIFDPNDHPLVLPLKRGQVFDGYLASKFCNPLLSLTLVTLY